MLDFFLRDEKIKHLGSGDFGLAKFIIKDDRSSARLRDALLGRVYAKFSLHADQMNDFELVFETLETEKFRKEVAAAAQKERAEQNAQGKAQVLGSSRSLIQMLASMYESPLKQVPSSPAGSSAQAVRSTPIFAQVRLRLCSPSLPPGERFSPVQYVCGMYTRIRDDGAPAEVDRPLPRLRSQVPSAAAAAGRRGDEGSNNMRASNPIAGPPAHQSVRLPDPGSSAQHAAALNVAAASTAAAAAAVRKKCQLVYTAAKPAARTAPATTPVSKPAVPPAVPAVSISPSVRTGPPAAAAPTAPPTPAAVPVRKPAVLYVDARPASGQASPVLVWFSLGFWSRLLRMRSPQAPMVSGRSA